MKPITKMVCNNGFTLVEMAMVLAIVALLLTGLVPTISSQVEQQRMRETRKQLEEIQQALIGYAIVNGRLPCPASPNGNGEENPIGGGSCANFFNGYVPATTLGIESAIDNQGKKGFAVDAWGNRIRYAVTSWSKTTAPTINNVYTTVGGIGSAGISNLAPNLLVCANAIASGFGGASCGTDNALTSGDGVPVVVFSTGKNGGYGGSGTDEAANLNNNRVYVSHTPTHEATANGEFDDLVIWISNHLLIGRMVAAGKLP